MMRKIRHASNGNAHLVASCGVGAGGHQWKSRTPRDDGIISACMCCFDNVLNFDKWDLELTRERFVIGYLLGFCGIRGFLGPDV